MFKVTGGSWYAFVITATTGKDQIDLLRTALAHDKFIQVGTLGQGRTCGGYPKSYGSWHFEEAPQAVAVSISK